jgi:hypothetical protein
MEDMIALKKHLVDNNIADADSVAVMGWYNLIGISFPILHII